MAAVPDVTVKVRIESDNLTGEQLARAEALLCARKALTHGPAFGTAEFSAIDLHALAMFVLEGGDPWGVPAEIAGPDDDAHD